MCEDVSPKRKADLEQWVEEVKQQWRDIQARRTARRHKRSALKDGKLFYCFFFIYFFFPSLFSNISVIFFTHWLPIFKGS